MKTSVKLALTTFATACTVLAAAPTAHAQCMIGEVRYFAGNFAPRGWAMAQGQLLPISQNQALFSILGTTYGGDGRTTFALPDLRGRAPLGAGRGPGLSDRRLGQKGGTESATVTVSVPVPGSTAAAHSHPFVKKAAERSRRRRRRGRFGRVARAPTVLAAGIARRGQPGLVIGETTAGSSSAAKTVTSQSTVSTVAPYVTLTPIICLQGVFPSRS